MCLPNRNGKRNGGSAGKNKECGRWRAGQKTRQAVDFSFLTACRGGRGDQFLQNFKKSCRKTNSGHVVYPWQSNFFWQRNGLRSWQLRRKRIVPNRLAIEQGDECP
jgi:hypothetical protein